LSIVFSENVIISLKFASFYVETELTASKLNSIAYVCNLNQFVKDDASTDGVSHGVLTWFGTM
jgi:hypothetical protein